MLPGSLRPAAALLPGVPRGTDGTAEAGGFRGGLTGHLPVVPSPAGAGRAREVSASSVVLLPHAPASVIAARGQIGTDLREAGIVSPAIGDATLVVSELLIERHPARQAAARRPGAGGVGAARAIARGGGERRRRHDPAADRTALALLDRRPRARHRGEPVLALGVLPNDFGLTVWAVLPAPGGDRVGYGGGLVATAAAWSATAAAATAGTTTAAVRPASRHNRSLPRPRWPWLWSAAPLTR